jgi:DNA-binding CsgD family transcriptional regulator
MRELHAMKRAKLSEVQTTVLYMVIHRYSYSDIAERLGVSEKQLYLHLTHIYRKLAVSQCGGVNVGKRFAVQAE